MLAFLKKVVGWLWSPIGLVGLIAAAFAIKKSKDNRITSLKDALVVEKARRDVVASETRAQVFTQEAIAKGIEVGKASEKARAQKRRIVEIESKQPTENMTDEQIAEEFGKLRF
jgi:hypothetical protein